MLVLFTLSANFGLNRSFANADPTPVLIVKYPASDLIVTYTKRVNYFVELLELALQKSGRPYQLDKIQTPLLLENRSKNNIQQKLYDIHWMNAKANLEADLRPIRIPLCKGLTGWRILFIRPKSQQDFSKITNFQDLNEFTAIHGHDWPEKYLYQHNHLKQKLANNFKSFFLMLNRERGDYLSRSVLEIFEEENAFPNLDISVEKDLVIHYPAAYYFYVAKDNIELVTIIESGLKAAIADGPFDEVFNRYFSDTIKKANLSNRRIIEMPFSDADFIDQSNSGYWYTSETTDNL